ncbi:MAG: hypothetical protein PHC70_00140 [Patescibacteria group bacterium]|jgi:hypothetical protein|nr:hypothetical protein [Patescibacteria group bacterium]
MVKAWLKKYWFGFVLAALLLVYEISSLVIFVQLAPNGTQWLGGLSFNTSDYGVYLNYLLQIKNGFLISNLFNNLPQVPRLDVFWSTAGLLVRSGLSPIATHELLRWAMTIILAFAVYATAKTLTSTEKRARLASIFMLGGMSIGWVYAALRDLGILDLPSPSPAPPDLVTEFGAAPVLLGGAHMILSFALLLLLMRWIYELICLEKRNLWPRLIVLTVLFTWLHPYFMPLLGLQMFFCLAYSFFQTKKAKTFGYFLLSALALLPAAAYYAWLAFLDPAFRNHHLIYNRLVLSAPWAWVLALITMAWAASRMLFKKIQPEFYWPHKPIWVVFWIASAVICLMLPFPWQRKYTQGLLMATVILALPYWLSLGEFVFSKWRSGVRNLLVLLAFIFFIAASYYYLLQIQLTAIRSDFAPHFYQPNAVFAAWKSLSGKQNLIITDDPWINIWTPAETGQHVWIGHAHETPDYFARLDQYTAWMNTDKPDDFNQFLNDTKITAIIITRKDNPARVEKLIDKSEWQKRFEENQTIVWTRR